MGFWDSVLITFKTIRLSDIFDMLIMGFILYKVLTFLAKTGSGRAFRGLIFIIAAMVVANWLDLKMIRFVFGKALELGVLVLIIVFQPEVRSVLEKIGAITKYIHGAERSNELGGCIDEVVKACETMSKSKTGALIVFEKDNVLDDIIQTGDLIDVETRSILLQHIFDKNTILHDGALIIRNERIYAARCRLPMSDSTVLPQRYGMRHRAGLGISERTDAVVVIVSEQTGDIAVACDGQIISHLAKDTLENQLKRRLIRDEEKKKWKPQDILEKLNGLYDRLKTGLKPKEDDENEDHQEDNRQ